MTPFPGSPGFHRSLGRYSPVAPTSPANVSAHIPPWDALPTPAELKDDAIPVQPHDHDCRAHESTFSSADFTPDPPIGSTPPCQELMVYGGKHWNNAQRPWLECFTPFYETGPWAPSWEFLGPTNLVRPKLYLYGDFRTAVAHNNSDANTQTIWANRLNLDFDFWITATERFHMFYGPLDEGVQFSSIIFDGNDVEVDEHFDEWDENTDTMFFEGDLGYILGGLQGIDAPFDLPFALGLVPLVLQNGVWLEDAFVGGAFTIPARNSPTLDWSNFDTTFFFGFEELTTPAFGGVNDDTDFVGVTTFIERRGGYLELGYAYVDDPTGANQDYHNLGVSYTRRYLNLVSSAARVIVNTGQSGPRDQRTADGFLVLLENSFLTARPYNVIPYANFFAGFRQPQSLGRLQGPLKNTGINFESDLLTGFPILDDTANNTWGGAFGIDLLGRDFDRQLVIELAMLQAFGDQATRNAPGDQYAVGLRWQRPINNAVILRADGMYGWRDNAGDVSGMRFEVRHKF